MNYLTETHTYDGHLTKQYNKLTKLEDNTFKAPMSFEDTITDIFKFLDKIKDSNHYDNVKRTLELFLSDSRNNYDNSNKICTKDILPRTWRYVKDMEFNTKVLFMEQLSDISVSGPCPQGRVTRIFQFYRFAVRDALGLK